MTTVTRNVSKGYQPVLFDVRQVAAMFGKCESTIRLWIRRGWMPPSKAPFNRYGHRRRVWTARQLTEWFAD